MIDEIGNLRALFFGDGLMFALYMSLQIGWVDGELASLAYHHLTFSVVNEQFVEHIHWVGTVCNNERLLCRNVSPYGTGKRSRDVRACALAAPGDLRANFTFFLPVFDGDHDIRNNVLWDNIIFGPVTNARSVLWYFFRIYYL